MMYICLVALRKDNIVKSNSSVNESLQNIRRKLDMGFLNKVGSTQPYKIKLKFLKT